MMVAWCMVDDGSSSNILFRSTYVLTSEIVPLMTRVATMGRVRVVEEATQTCEDIDQEVGQAEGLEVDQEVKSFDSKSEVEDVLVRRRTYKTCFVLRSCPLGGYDVDREPLNRLDMTSKLRGLVDGPSEEPLGPAPVGQLVMDDPPAKRERPSGKGCLRPSLGACSATRLFSHSDCCMELAFMKLSLSCDSSRGSSIALCELIKILEAAFITKEANLLVKGHALSEIEALSLQNQSMISGLEAMLGTRNQENNIEHTGLRQSTIREQVGSSKTTIKLEGSSLGKFDEEMVGPSVEEGVLKGFVDSFYLLIFLRIDHDREVFDDAIVLPLVVALDLCSGNLVPESGHSTPKFPFDGKGLSIWDFSLDGHKDGLKFLRQKGEACVLLLLVLLVLWNGRSVKLPLFPTISSRVFIIVFAPSVLATRGLGSVAGTYMCAWQVMGLQDVL
uniref:Uncharacterized protein n=1 Tax=Cannabis sativa TaxID=3483 RepID=A0A803PZ66_CANSA